MCDWRRYIFRQFTVDIIIMHSALWCDFIACKYIVDNYFNVCDCGCDAIINVKTECMKVALSEWIRNLVCLVKLHAMLTYSHVRCDFKSTKNPNAKPLVNK